MTTGMAILQPVVALAIWTMVMWLWMYATRIPAMNKAPEIDTANLTGGTGKDLDAVLPANVQWKAHNYNHLHEQPTVFYAIAITLAIVGQGDGINALLGWMYMGLRVIHSLVQVTANKVLVRFILFALSSLVLIALILHATLFLFDIHM
ncbi:MAPEG family protein [Parerythrobacter aestuarii]|uniref:MAPEG family protein n=1 Tax=Parerythrobacter aestuarii TaxID=3020909 RepID=UPI0024DEA865|nr:MAPEG family protein [Parerythrobacter aestuarii]